MPVIQRQTASGKLIIAGEFDEVTKLQAPAGDTNLLFNYSGGTATGTTYAAFDFGTDGTVTGTTTSSNGTWYNGTPTGSNFEIQLRLDSASTSGGSTIPVLIELEEIATPGNFSQWYTLNVLRTIYINVGGVPYTRTNVITVFIREISIPTNIISQSFTLQLN